MPTSEIPISPPLVSRITPRSSPRKWGSPNAYRGPTNRFKKGAPSQFPTSESPSASLRRSTGKKAAVRTPQASPKSLIQRLSDSPLTRKGGPIVKPSFQVGPPESPTRLLDRLMKSEVLSTMLSHGSNNSMDTSEVQELAADNMVVDGPSSMLATQTDVEIAAQTPSQPVSPILADVNETVRVGGNLDIVKQEMIPPNLASLVNVNPPETSPTSEPVSASLYEECKRLVAQLVVQNAQAREPNADIAAQSERLEKQIAVLVTDESCMDFIATAKQIQKQMAAKKDFSVEETSTGQNGDSIVGVKRRRDKVDDVVSSSPIKIGVRLEPDKSGLGRGDTAMPSVSSSRNKSAPRAPKAMIKKEQHMNKIMSMVPSSYDSSVSIPPVRNGTHRSTSKHEIPIPLDEKYFKHPPSPERRDSYGDMSWVKRHKQDNDERPRDVDHRRQVSGNSDIGTDKSDHERRASDSRAREIDHHRRESRDAYSERSERRRRDRDDRERDRDDGRYSLRSDSGKHSSAKSNHRTSDDLIATRMSAPKLSSPVDTRPRKPPPIIPTCPVPGLWFVKVGLEQADILDVEFDISPELTTHRENSSGVAFHLLCLPTNSVRETLETLDQTASPEEVTDALWNITTQWPPRGQLLIEVNPGDTVGRNWLPFELDPTGLPLNLTTHVRQGQNNIRFIHLGDLSGHIFMLHVAESRPSPLSFPLDQILNSNYTPTQGPVNSHWHPYIHQSSTKTDQSVDACASTFKFFGKVTRSIQPLNY